MKKASMGGVVRFGFFIPSNFSLIALGSAVDPLRIANMVAGKGIFEYTVIGDCAGVRSSDGIVVMPELDVGVDCNVDAMFVVGPNPVPPALPAGLMDWFHKLSRDRVSFGGIDTGSYFLARSGMLRGYRCTIHWEDRDILTESFEDVVVSNRVFEIDRDRYTCSGGIAPLYMMCELIEMYAGIKSLGKRVLELLIASRTAVDALQPSAIEFYSGAQIEKLNEALRLMRSNTEDPLDVPEIASIVGVSVRQLQRYFREKFGKSMSRIYLELRLQRARMLVSRTGLEIEEIAARTGFKSQSHFTFRYHELFGRAPSVERRALKRD